MNKTRLQTYFNGQGFERWSAIYGDGELSAVRRSIRAGHAQMLNTAVAWLTAQPATAQPILDAGCGTGLLSCALATRGFRVRAVDLAPQMAAATARAAAAAGVGALVQAEADDLELVQGRFAAVACLDVLIHYPQDGFASMIAHLASLSDGPLVFTYAPHEPLLAALHRIGKHFPQGQRHTNITMLRDTFVAGVLAEHGRRIRRSERVSKGFYHVTLVEC